MKILLLILVAACCAALFLLPFERAKKGYVQPQKPTTLAGVTLSLLRAISSDDIKKSAAAIAGALALAAVWAPLVIILEARWLAPPLSAASQALLILQGLLIALAGAATFLIMAMNSMTFGFGASKATEPTPLFVTILAIEAISAIATIVLWASPSTLAWLHKLVG